MVAVATDSRDTPRTVGKIAALRGHSTDVSPMDPGSASRIDGATVDLLLAERDWLLALSRRLLRDDGAAHDLAQDTLLKAIEKPPASAAAPRAFLATVLRRAAGKFARGVSRRRAREQRAAVAERLPDAAQLAAEAEARRAVVDAVLELAEPYRRTILLRFFRGVPSSAIAKEEGVTAAAIDTRVFRALAVLRARLDARYGDRARWSVPLLAAAQEWTATKAGVSAIAGGIVMNAVGKFGVASGIAIAIALGVAFRSPRSDAPSAIEIDRARAMAPRVADQASRPSPTNSSEREPVAIDGEALETRSEARILVVDAAGAPLPFARLIVERGGALESHRADESGRCVIEVSEPLAAVAVTATGHAPQRVDRVLEPGEHRIELAAGSELSGVVRVDGDQPDRPVRVFFDYTAPSIFEWSQRARAVTAEGFEFLETWADESGAFRFRGLPEDAHGDLRVDEQRHRFRGDSESFRVSHPTLDVVLDLTSNPRVIGRVVDSAGAPLDDAHVYLRYGPDDGDPIASRLELTDESGRFEHWIRIDGPDFATRPWVARVRVVAADRVRETERTVEVHDAGVFDLGDVTVLDAVATPFRAIDAEGAPVAGVVAFDDELRGALCDPTDATGHGLLRIGAPVDRVYFAAVEREVVAVDVERGRSATVRIPRAAALSVSMRRGNGEPPKLAFIEIESRAGDPFAVPDGGFPIDSLPAMPESFGEPRSQGSVEADSLWRVRYEIRGGAAKIQRLRPGVAIDVKALDGAGREIEVRREVVLAAGESRAMDFSNFPAAHRLTLRVFAPDRRPICGAVADLVDESGDGRRSEVSDASGLLRFDEVESDRAELVLRAPRFAPARVTIEGIADAAGRAFEVILEPGRRVELRVVDCGGHPIAALTEVFAGTREDGSDPDLSSFARWFSDGRYVFEDLPPRGPLWFFIEVGGRRFAQRHDSPAGDATLVVPEHGSLVLAYEFAPATNYVPRLHLTDSRAGEVFEFEFPDFAPRPGQVVFPHVPPGRYTVNLRSAKDDEAGADRILGVVDGVVEVLAHRTTKVVARRP